MYFNLPGGKPGETAPEVQKKTMDIIGDSNTDAKDYLLLKAHILGTCKIR